MKGVISSHGDAMGTNHYLASITNSSQGEQSVFLAHSSVIGERGKKVEKERKKRKKLFQSLVDQKTVLGPGTIYHQSTTDPWFHLFLSRQEPIFLVYVPPGFPWLVPHLSDYGYNQKGLVPARLSDQHSILV